MLSVIFDVVLDPSPVQYVVIPCTFLPKLECKVCLLGCALRDGVAQHSLIRHVQFTMTFTTEGADALTLEPLSPSKEWKHVMIDVRKHVR